MILIDSKSDHNRLDDLMSLGGGGGAGKGELLGWSETGEWLKEEV